MSRSKKTRKNKKLMLTLVRLKLSQQCLMILKMLLARISAFILIRKIFHLLKADLKNK